MSPNTTKISKTLQERIRLTGGRIFQYDPSTGMFSDIVTSGNKVVR